MIFHLTKKAQDLLGMPPTDLAVVPANDPQPLAAWYVNVVVIERRKCLLVMEASTFYVVYVPGVTKRDLGDFGGLVRRSLREVLALDGFSEEEVGRVVAAESDIFAKTSDKRVLGCMVEQAFLLSCTVADSGGLAKVAATSVNGELNRAILMPLKSVFPVEAMRAAVAAKARSASELA